MKTFLLLGAGFSRNWGGWLANEAFEYLLGCPEVQNRPALVQLLWRKKNNGGFEAALADVQDEHRHGRDSGSLPAFQSAIVRMFDDMNAGYVQLSDGLEFSNQTGSLVRELLVRFDAIFTLNQDILLEMHYLNDNVSLSQGSRWNAAVLPGVKRVPGNTVHFGAQGWKDARWEVQGTAYAVGQRDQPVFKLHGSSQWVDPRGSDLLVMGAAKSATIAQSPLLNQYLADFAAMLTAQPARLMVIGYSFTDGHINAILQNAGARGLRIFIIDPLGVDVVNPTRAAPIRAPAPLEEFIMGASRRSLREIFGGDRVEHAKVMRFFS